MCARSAGRASTFDWIINRDLAIYAVVIAALWQGAGLVMILVLASMRGIDGEQWRAARIDGIPVWRTYVSIILPQRYTAFAAGGHALSMGVIKTYDIVVALTSGGPGSATEVPAKFIMDNLFQRQNLGLAAAATVLLLTVLDHHRAVPLCPTHPRPAPGEYPMTTHPRGPKPARSSVARVGLYTFLISAALFFAVPLYVMIVTSLKTMDEIRLGQIFALPAPSRFHRLADRPWSAPAPATNAAACAWASGTRSRSPSRPSHISVFFGAINGYALSFWRPKGSRVMFGMLTARSFPTRSSSIRWCLA